MESVTSMRISGGIRIGHWNPEPGWGNTPFSCVGFYYGPELGDKIPGEKITWPLLDGNLVMRVGVLFRPDLGKRQKLETILILESYVEEMWEYDDFQKEPIAADN
jgi:hypothetical protein